MQNIVSDNLHFQLIASIKDVFCFKTMLLKFNFIKFKHDRFEKFDKDSCKQVSYFFMLFPAVLFHNNRQYCDLMFTGMIPAKYLKTIDMVSL